METILLIAVIGVMNITCFFVGAKVGQKVIKGEDIKTPVKAVKEYREAKEDERIEREAQEEYETNLYNINNYTPSGLGQRDFD